MRSPYETQVYGPSAAISRTAYGYAAAGHASILAYRATNVQSLVPAGSTPRFLQGAEPEDCRRITPGCC
jgi:hypothetical protein